VNKLYYKKKHFIDLKKDNNNNNTRLCTYIIEQAPIKYSNRKNYFIRFLNLSDVRCITTFNLTLNGKHVAIFIHQNIDDMFLTGCSLLI